jgi:hypothetical protein
MHGGIEDGARESSASQEERDFPADEAQRRQRVRLAGVWDAPEPLEPKPVLLRAPAGSAEAECAAGGAAEGGVGRKAAETCSGGAAPQDDDNDRPGVNLVLLLGAGILTLAILAFILLIVGLLTGCAADHPRLPGLI